MDVGKREDRLLDKIGSLVVARDAALAWIDLYIHNGELSADLGQFLSGVLRGDTEETKS